MEGAEIDLRGKVALVTGSGRGIGMVTALTLHEAGACVAVKDINLKAAETVCKRLGKYAMSVQANIGSHEEVRKMVKTVSR